MTDSTKVQSNDVATPSHLPSCLDVQGLSKRFGSKIALNDVNFEVGQGEIVGLIGPNGAGKSTIVEILSGCVPPDKGNAIFKGRDLLTLRGASAISRFGVARTFQKLRPFLSMSTMDNVMIPCLVRGHSEAEARQRSRECLEVVGLAGKASSLANMLSTGQRKRLELARAIATNAELYLLDEVTQGVDTATTHQLVQLILRLRDEFGGSVLIIDHDMSVLSRLCDRLIAMDLGSIVTEGTVDDVLNHPIVVSSYIDG